MERRIDIRSGRMLYSQWSADTVCYWTIASTVEKSSSLVPGDRPKEYSVTTYVGFGFGQYRRFLETRVYMMVDLSEKQRFFLFYVVLRTTT